MQGCQVQDILATNIRRIRREMGYSQSHLAELAGISPGYMCDIENTRKWPSSEKLAELAEALQLDPFQLLLPTDDSPYFDRHRTLTAFSRLLQERFKESVAEVFKYMLQPYGPMRENTDLIDSPD